MESFLSVCTKKHIEKNNYELYLRYTKSETFLKKLLDHYIYYIVIRYCHANKVVTVQDLLSYTTAFFRLQKEPKIAVL